MEVENNDNLISMRFKTPEHLAAAQQMYFQKFPEQQGRLCTAGGNSLTIPKPHSPWLFRKLRTQGIAFRKFPCKSEEQGLKECQAAIDLRNQMGAAAAQLLRRFLNKLDTMSDNAGFELEELRPERIAYIRKTMIAALDKE